jgi:hypothetical protein
MRAIPSLLLDKIQQAYQTAHGNADPKLDIIIQQSTQALEQGLMLNPCTLWVDEELTAIDVAVSRQDKNQAPQELSMVYIVDGIAKLATLSTTDNVCRDWVYRKDLGSAVDCAIDYDGRWQRITGFDDEFYSVTSRWALVTFGEPYIALVKPDGSLTIQQGDSEPIELAGTGVTRVSLMRGWKNAIIYNADQGIICAYIKDGDVMYRSYCLQPPADPALWEVERQVEEFDTSINPATHISLFRTNDYRAGFLAEINGEMHMSVTERNWSGMAIDDHTITATVTDLAVALLPITYPNVYAGEHTVTATISTLSAKLCPEIYPTIIDIYNEPDTPTEIHIQFDKTMSSSGNLATAFSVRDNAMTTYAVSGASITGDTLTLTTTNFEGASGDIAITYTYNTAPVFWINDEGGCHMEIGNFVETFTPDLAPPELYTEHSITATISGLDVDLLLVTFPNVCDDAEHAITVSMDKRTSATAVVGNPATANGHLDVTYGIAGTLGNAKKMLVQNGAAEGALSAVATASGITLTLGMDDSDPAVPDDAKNTATLIAGVIDALTDYSATADGTGALVPAIAHNDEISFSGGTSSLLIDLIHVDDIDP